MKISENVKFTIVQAGKQFICLTQAETGKPIVSQGNKTKNQEFQISFGAPFVYPIDDKNIKGHLFDSPKEFAEAVKNAMRQMGNETKEIFLCAEGAEVISQEYKHAAAKEKFLNNVAELETKTLVADEVSNYNIIRCEYGSAYGKTSENKEMLAALFAMSKEQISQLKAAFEEQFLKIVKFIPPEAALIKAANTSVTSFDKVVALFSMDYVSIRLIIMQNGAPIFCHSFQSPFGDIAEAVAKDKEISFAEAVEYVRKTGIGLSEECNFPQTEHTITDLLESAAGEILRNLRMVLLSSRLDLDQIFLSDSIGLMPGVVKYLRQLGLTADINFISDSFLPSSNVPMLQPSAEENGFKSAAFYMMSFLINCGAIYENNLFYGVNETKQASNKIGKYAATALAIVACLAMLFVGWQSFSLEMRKSSDELKLANPMYKEAKQLQLKQEELLQKEKGIESDKKLLPTTEVTVNEIIDNVFKQITEKVKKVNTYTIDHKENTIALNFDVSSLQAYVDLKNQLGENNYFTIAKPFTATGDETTKEYNCNVTLGVRKLQEEKAAAEKAAAEKAKIEHESLPDVPTEGK